MSQEEINENQVSDEESILDDSKKENSKKVSSPLIIFIITLVILSLGYLFFLKPNYTKLNETKIAITEEKQNIELLNLKFKELTKLLSDLDEKIEESKTTENNIEHVIPSNFEIFEFLEMIDFFTHESKGYQLSLMSISELIPLENYPNIGELTLRLTLKCSMQKLIDLVETLESENQIFIIDGLSIDEEANVLEEEIEQELTIKTYYQTDSK